MDDNGKGKMDDKGKGKIDDLVDVIEKGKSNLMVSEKGTKKASKKTKEAKEAEVDEEDSSDEDLVLFNHVKYPLSDAEIRMFKERPTTSTSTNQELPLLPQDPELLLHPLPMHNLPLQEGTGK
ncbi:hypothetical protein Tco_0743469 [Tanacetum coccineum]